MKNTEMRFTPEQEANIMMMEKANQDNQRKKKQAGQNTIEGKPSIILPVIDGIQKSKDPIADNARRINDAVIKATDGESDSGKNYTAAENDHDTNATL